MPELPEVQTIVVGLRQKIIGLKIRDVWYDWPKSIKLPKDKRQFKALLKNQKVVGITRKGKNILIGLSNDYVLLIHLKLTGHPLYGRWILKKKSWVSATKNRKLSEADNKYIHFLLTFTNGRMLALSDLRKFAKIMLFPQNQLDQLDDLNKLGPDPISDNFTSKVFNNLVKNIISKRPGLKIKQFLMDQSVLSGIGNIYSDEILFQAKIHPLTPISKLKEKDWKNILKSIKRVLLSAIKNRGSTVGYGDYRDIQGRSGNYSRLIKVYDREGEKCLHCKGLIRRIKIGSRSSYFCPQCQKL